MSARARAVAINDEAFRLYVETQLIKTLKPGDIIVLDNLGSHKSAAVRDIVRAAGAQLSFLLPHIPNQCRAGGPSHQPIQRCSRPCSITETNRGTGCIAAKPMPPFDGGQCGHRGLRGICSCNVEVGHAQI